MNPDEPNPAAGSDEPVGDFKGGAGWVDLFLSAQFEGLPARRELCLRAQAERITPSALGRWLRETFPLPDAERLANEIQAVLLSEQAMRMILASESVREDLDPIKAHWNWPAIVDTALVEKIRALTGQLDEEESDQNGEVFRALCRLARQWGIDPETYRRMLRRARLLPARASEIKTVLAHEPAAGKFVRARNHISWKAALHLARAAHPDALKRAARQLVRLVVRAPNVPQQGFFEAAPDAYLWRDILECYHLTTPAGKLTIEIMQDQINPCPGKEFGRLVT